VNRPIVLLDVRVAADGTSEVVSPGVGWWCDHPSPGALVGAGTQVGVLEVQNRRFRLVLPDGTAGRITGPLPGDRRVAVEYGQCLFRLVAVSAGDAVGFESGAVGRGHPGGADLPEGARAVLAPTDGVFYTRPAPDTDPFVAIGDTITSGHSIGLIEVMKTFNQIHYGGPGFAERATVIEVRVGDGDEVRAGQVLVVVR
jgi:acetyl-CoA carboxylase biotin carboxyl carrier protein